jgi:hypothetical protein
MKHKTFLLSFALLASMALKAQTPQTNPKSSAEMPAVVTGDYDDPAFKALPLEEQQFIRYAVSTMTKAFTDHDARAMGRLGLEITDVISAPPTYAFQKPATAGCDATPVKKPKIHLPRVLQDAINKNADKLNNKTGVQVDPNAPAQTIDKAQNTPCPPAK